MRRLLLAAGLIAVPLVPSCGGSSTSPSAAPVTTPAPSTSQGPVSRNMALRSQLDLAALGVTAGSGCWGYTSPSDRRFALMGTSAGMSVVDVTNPASARITGAIAGGSSAWREIRTYGQLAYVTTEAQTGLDIVDLRDPDRPAKLRTWS